VYAVISFSVEGVSVCAGCVTRVRDSSIFQHGNFMLVIIDAVIWPPIRTRKYVQFTC